MLMAKFLLLSCLIAVTSYSLRRAEGDDCDPRSRLLQKFPAADVDLNPDGSMLAGVAINRQAVIVWDIKSAQVLYQLQLPLATLYGVIWSPDGRRLLITGNRTFVVTATLLPLLNLSTHFSSWGAWSPDSTMFATTTAATGSYVCRVWRVDTGNVTAQWKSGAFNQVSWSPAALVAVPVGIFHPNGTLSIALSTGAPLAWGTNNTLAFFYGPRLMVVNSSGAILHSVTEEVRVRTLTWSQNGLFLAYCAPRCIIRDVVSMAVVADLGGLSHSGVRSFSQERGLLVTLPLQTSFAEVWTTQTAIVRSFPRPSPYGTDATVMWYDADNFRICYDSKTEAEAEVESDDKKVENRVSICEETNARTMESTSFHMVRSDEEVSKCEMQSEVFVIYDNGTVLVLKQGQIIRQWQSYPDSQIFCAYDGVVAVAPYFDRNITISDKEGVPIRTILTDSFAEQVAVISEEVVAYAYLYVLYLYPGTSRARNVPIPTLASELRWSPDGTWIAVRFEQSWRLYNEDGSEFGGNQAILAMYWTDDNQFASVDWIGDFIFVNPSQELVHVFRESLCTFTGAWNRFTLEVLCLSSDSVVLLKPILTELQGLSASSRTVGTNATFKVTAFTAFLPIPRYAMIRWIDTSTSIAQCLFVDVTDVNKSVVTLETVVLPQPGLYIVYLPGVPWVGTDPASITASCLEPALPSININGGLTACVCPSHMYVVAPFNSVIQCSLCPKHGVCDGTDEVNAQRGFWSITPTQFLPCASGACIGNNSCASFYEGPLCGFCVHGAGQHGFGRCQRCNKARDSVFLVFGLLFWVVLCVFQSLFALGWTWKSRQKTEGRMNNSAQLAAIMMSTVQANALLLSLNVDLKSMYHSLGYVEEFTQNGVPSAAVSCLLLEAGFESGAIHYIKQLIVLILPFFAWAGLHVVRAILRLCGVGSSVDIVRVPTVVVWASLQAFIYTSTLQTLDCIHMNPEEEGVYRLRHDLSVMCYNKPYWWFLGFVTIPAILLSWVVPISMYWLLRFHPTASGSGHLRFLVNSYRADWWFLVIVGRKIILSILVTWTRNPFYIAFCLTLACALQVIVSPSTSRVVNIAESISLLSSIFVFSVAGSLSLDDTFQTYDQAGSILLSAAAMSYLFQLSLLVYDRRWSGKPPRTSQFGALGDPFYTRIDS